MSTPSFTWDDEARAGYLRVRELAFGEFVHRTVELVNEPNVLLDVDENGRILGVEFLSDVRLSTLLRVTDKLGLRLDCEVSDADSDARRSADPAG